MKTKKALYIVAGLVFVAGLAFAFGSNDSFTGNFSGVLKGTSGPKELLSDGKTATQRLNGIKGLLKDEALVSEVADKLDDDRYTGVIDMTREDAQEELDMLTGYIDEFNANQSVMEAQVNLTDPDLTVIELSLEENESLFTKMEVQYRFLEDYRDYQNELSASAAVFYEAFATIAEENQEDYDALLEEQAELRLELLERLDERGLLLQDIVYLQTSEVDFETDSYDWDSNKSFVNDLDVPELHSPAMNELGPFNFPQFYVEFREHLYAEKSGVIDCMNAGPYQSLSGAFSSDSMSRFTSACLINDNRYLRAPFRNYPLPGGMADIYESPAQISSLISAIESARNYSELDSALNDYFDAYHTASQLIADDYEALFEDYIDTALDEIASIDASLSTMLNRLASIASELETLQAQAELISTEGQETLDELQVTSAEANENFEWMLEELSSIDLSALVNINSLYATAYSQLLAEAYSSVEESYGGEVTEDTSEPEEEEDVPEEEEKVLMEASEIVDFVKSTLVEEYAYDKEEAVEIAEDFSQKSSENEWTEEEFMQAFEAWLVEQGLKEEEVEVEEKEEDVSEEEVLEEKELEYEELAREIVEAYGVQYKEVEEDLQELIEKATDEAAMDEADFRSEVERITEAYIASSQTDGYLYSLDQIRYMEDADVFMVNYSAVWLGAGRSEVENVDLNVNWNDSEDVSFNVSVAISGNGQLYEIKGIRDKLPYSEDALNTYTFSLSGSSLSYEIDNTPEEIEEPKELEEPEVKEEEVEAEEVIEEEVEVETSEIEELQEELEEALAAAEQAAESAASAASAAESAATAAVNNNSSNNSQPQTVEVVIEAPVVETTTVADTSVSNSSVEVVQDSNSPFVDVMEGTWYGDAIITLYDEKIMRGNDEGEAEPWKNGNRAELIVMIVRAFYDEAELAQMNFEHQFVDVPETAWYNMHVSAAVEFNILDEKDYFYPSRNMTRAEFITSFIRAANRACVRCDADFVDVKRSDWYYRALATAVSADLIAGFEDGTFRPNDEINRAQVAAIFEKALEIGWVR